jgi:phage-related protein
MLYITADRTINFEDFNYILKTNKYEQIPTLRNSQKSVIGRNGNFTFRDGFNNKNIKVKLTAIDSPDIMIRRANARELTQELIKPGKLVLDYEKNIYYDANVFNGATVKFNSSYDELDIEFNVDAIAFSRIGGNLVWEDTDIPWNSIDIPWSGDAFNYDVVSTDVIEVINRGNIESGPIITIEGVGDVTFTHTNGKTFTYTGLNGIINIDSRNMIVYDDSLVNQITNYSGDFIELDVGTNSITITGTFVTLNINFAKKDFYI